MLAVEGTTPARLKKIREAIPTSRKITKTDLAKYLNAWDMRPELVSLGAQKNFERFMECFKEDEGQPPLNLPDLVSYKHMIAKAILFKKAGALVRPMFPAFQGNVVTYLVSLVANRLGEKIDLEKVWLKQDISKELKKQLELWAREVNSVLHSSSGGRMISEWAKKDECWEAVRSASYSPVMKSIPELR